MNPIYLEVLGALVRWALGAVGGYLVGHHILTADQSDRFSGAILDHMLLSAPLVAALLWSIWQKLRQRLTVAVALDMQPGSSQKALATEMKDTTVGETLKGTLPMCLAVVMIAAAVTLPGCASLAPPPNLTPAAVYAFHATGIEKDLDLVRDTAISANDAGQLLSTDSTRRVVQWHRSAIVIMHAGGDGWKAAVKSGLTETLSHLSPAEQATLAPYVALVLSVLNEVA